MKKSDNLNDKYRIRHNKYGGIIACINIVYLRLSDLERISWVVLFIKHLVKKTFTL